MFMRVQPYGVGSFVHIVKRGTRGLSIVRDNEDRQRFLLMLAHFNDKFAPENWFRDLVDNKLFNSFERPPTWPNQDKIVKVICFCLLDNHFHLLLEEIEEGGVAKFMQRFGTAMSKHFNEKYKEKGSMFQGSYRSKTISNDNYLRYVSAYIQVKNAFDIFPGGYASAVKNFDKAYAWAVTSPFSSVGDYAGKHARPIVDKEFLSQTFTPSEYKKFSKDFVEGRKHPSEEVESLLFE